MPRNLFFLLSFLSLTSCEAFQVITAVDHKPRIQSPESIRHYAQKHGFDGYPILTFDTAIMSGEADIWLKFNMYNKEGKYLSLDDQISGCPDRKKDYAAMRYLLQHGEEHFLQDSASMYKGVLKDTNLLKTTDMKELSKLRKDTSIWHVDTVRYSTHLDTYVPFFRTLEGEAVDIYSLYDQYLMLYGFEMSGYSKFHCIMIREKIRELEKLKKEFGSRIQLVLVNRDQMVANR
ncbi:MAG: hypothetical protein IPL92_17400 [Saprospiraceae bacterium]|nr:hypothetical protein [Candidatus Opimibacter iunctus]